MLSAFTNFPDTSSLRTYALPLAVSSTRSVPLRYFFNNSNVSGHSL